MKRVYPDKFVIGNSYFVVCGIWQGEFIYCGIDNRSNALRPKFRFTCGSVDNWRKQFNIVSCKSNIKVYEI